MNHYPELPEKPVAIYSDIMPDGPVYVAITMTKEVVKFYMWDGISKQPSRYFSFRRHRDMEMTKLPVVFS